MDCEGGECEYRCIREDCIQTISSIVTQMERKQVVEDNLNNNNNSKTHLFAFVLKIQH